MNTYDKGDIARVSTEFTLAQVLTDPTTVTLKVRKPDGTQVTYTYAAAQVVKDSTGKYHFDVDLSSSPFGIWRYRWEGTGAVTSAEEGMFEVRGSKF